MPQSVTQTRQTKIEVMKRRQSIVSIVVAYSCGSSSFTDDLSPMDFINHHI